MSMEATTRSRNASSLIKQEKLRYSHFMTLFGDMCMEKPLPAYLFQIPFDHEHSWRFLSYLWSLVNLCWIEVRSTPSNEVTTEEYVRNEKDYKEGGALFIKKLKWMEKREIAQKLWLEKQMFRYWACRRLPLRTGWYLGCTALFISLQAVLNEPYAALALARLLSSPRII